MIQNCVSRSFLGAGDHWQQKESEAVHFDSSAAAVEYCIQHELSDCQLVLRFDGRPYDVVIPISGECRRRSSSKKK